MGRSKVVLVIGTSGSGKSTWVKTLDSTKYDIISVDNMRIEFTGDINNKSKDNEIYNLVKERTIHAINNGKDVVIDTTNLQKDRRRDFLNVIKETNPDVIFQYKLMELNPELAKQRIKNDIINSVCRADVSDLTIDRHTELYKEMLDDIKEEPITPFID